LSARRSVLTQALTVPVIHNFTAGFLDVSPAPKVVASRHLGEWVKVAGDHVTYPSNSSYCYSAEAETALQEELRLLADIEVRLRRSVRAYSDRRSRKPSRTAFPDSLRPLGESLRGPHVQRLAELHDELLRRKLYLLKTVH
jgi:hypothetical protein